MLRLIRRRLRLIRYYSAAREETAWTRAADISLVASLLLAPVAAWVADGAMVHPIDPITVSGVVLREGNAHRAVVTTVNGETTVTPVDVLDPARWADFRLESEGVIRGLPLRTSEFHDVPQVRLVFRDPDRASQTLMPEGEVFEAIMAGTESAAGHRLHEGRFAELMPVMQRWAEQREARTSLTGAWIGNTMLWMVILFVVSSVGLIVVRFSVILFFSTRSAKRAMRIAEGRCPECDYDLRGLEFSERCPECGKLTW